MTDVALPKQRVAFVDPKDGTVTREWWQWILNPQISTLAVVNNITVPNGSISAKQLHATQPITVPSGGLGIASGTSGGVLGFTASTTLASSALLGANQILLGGGAGATPSTPVGLGTTTTVLHGNVAGSPSFAAVSLTTDVSGILPVANGGTNAAAPGATAANNIGALAIASNLSDLNSATTARTNLGLGSMAVENSTAITVTGGSIDGTTIGGVTPAAGSFTTLTASGVVGAAGSPLIKTATRAVTAISGVKASTTQAVSNALTADSDLTLTFNENGTYALDGYLSFYESTVGTGGFQFDFNSGTATVGAINFGVEGFVTAAVANAAVTSVATATSFGTIVTSSSAPSWVRIAGYLTITGTGTLALRWAQASTLAIDPTNFLAGSRLMATKIG